MEYNSYINVFFIFKYIIFIILFENYLFSIPDYSTYSIKKDEINTKIINVKYGKEKISMAYIFDEGCSINNMVEKYEGNNLNSEFIFDDENDILYITCLSDFQIGKFNSINSEINFKNVNSNYKYNKYKCSIIMQYISNIKYIIMTQTNLEIDTEGNNIYNNIITKVDENLNFISQFNFSVRKNNEVTYDRIFQCISIELNTQIFCTYVENTIFGFFINSNFNEKENLKELFPESEKNLFFKLFPFNDNSIIILTLDSNLINLKINLITSSKKEITIRELFSLKDKTLNYLDLISISYISDNSFILFIGNTYFTYYWFEFTSNEIYYNNIMIHGNIFSQIQNAIMLYFDSKVRTFFSILNNNNYELYINNLIFPTQQLKCSFKQLNLISNEKGEFSINNIITFSQFDNSFLNLENTNELSINYENSKINYSVGKNGNFNSTIYYKFSNSDFEIKYSGLYCEINIKICNEACESCLEFSSNNKDTKCVSCEQNYYLSNIKKGYCSICSDNFYSIWNYNSYLEKSECLYDYNYCNEIISLDKPYMIYDTFECFDMCPSNYKYYIGNYCINNCNNDKMISNGVNCKCDDDYKFYLNRTNNKILCIENCFIDYPFLIPNINECVSICPSQTQIIFNYTCLDECPILTKQIKKGNLFTCECLYNSYEIKFNDLIYIGCTNEKKCPQGTYNNNNNCVNECDYFHSETKCLNSCNMNNYIQINKLCIEVNSLFENIDNYVLLLYSERNSYYLEKENYIIEVYNTSNEGLNFANSFTNISKIDLGLCKNRIQEKYSMNEELIVFKIDIFKLNLISSQVEYSIYTLQGKKIDLSICSTEKIIIYNYFNNSKINFDNMESLAKQGYDIFNPDDAFYTSICSNYKNEYETDVININRREDYYPNLTICEKNCEYKGLNLKDYSFKCECSFKNEMDLSDRKMGYNKWYSTFRYVLAPSNLKVFLCFKNAFIFNCFFNNYGQIFQTFCFIIQMILSILIIFRGLKYLFAKIYEMSEEKNLKRNNNDQIIILNKIERNNNTIIPKNNPPKKTQIKNVQVKFTNYLDSPNSINKFFKTKPYKKNTTQSLNLNIKKSYYKKKSQTPISKSPPLFKKNSLLKKNYNNSFSSSHSTIKNLEEESNEKIEKYFKKKKILKNKHNHNNKKLVFFQPQLNFFISKEEKKNKHNFNEKISKFSSEQTLKEKNISSNSIIQGMNYNKEEIMSMKFKMALKYDKMSFFGCYWFLLNYHQLFIFTFLNNIDYNLRSVKISLFIFELDLFLFFNALFFSDKQFTYLYRHKGKFNYFYNLPKAIFSSLICGLLNNFLAKLSLSHNIINKIKSKNNKISVYEMQTLIKNKFIIFFILLYFFMIFFWYYLSVFCSVFQNSQLALFKSSFLSFIISMTYPFLFCLLITAARKISIKKKWKFLFTLSRVINYL